MSNWHPISIIDALNLPVENITLVPYDAKHFITKPGQIHLDTCPRNIGKWDKEKTLPLERIREITDDDFCLCLYFKAALGKHHEKFQLGEIGSLFYESLDRAAGKKENRSAKDLLLPALEDEELFTKLNNRRYLLYYYRAHIKNHPDHPWFKPVTEELEKVNTFVLKHQETLVQKWENVARQKCFDFIDGSLTKTLTPISEKIQGDISRKIQTDIEEKVSKDHNFYLISDILHYHLTANQANPGADREDLFIVGPWGKKLEEYKGRMSAARPPLAAGAVFPRGETQLLYSNFLKEKSRQKNLHQHMMVW